MKHKLLIGKRVLLLLMCLLLSVSFFGCKKEKIESDNKGNNSTPDSAPVIETTPEAETKPVFSAKYIVGVIVSEESENNSKVFDGFEEAFKARDIDKTGFHHNLLLTVCDNDDEACKQAAKKYVDDGVDLIFAVGEKAAKAAAAASKKIPVVFCSVADPIEAGLVKSSAKPSGNVTGVSDFTPAEFQMELIRELLPDTRKVSALYCSTDKKSTLVSALAKSQAEAMRMTYDTFGAADDKNFNYQISKALKGADVLYLIEDELSLKNAEAVFEAADKAGVPVISSSDAFMSMGALATVLPDYNDLGYDAGELALICLKGLKKIGDISVEYPQLCVRYVSTSAAKKLTLDVSTVNNITAVD